MRSTKQRLALLSGRVTRPVGSAEGLRMRAPRVSRGFSASRQRRSAPQRGAWGTDPPDPGSAPARKVCLLQVLIVCRLANHQHLATILNPLAQPLRQEKLPLVTPCSNLGFAGLVSDYSAKIYCDNCFFWDRCGNSNYVGVKARYSTER